eukprot:scaffold187_cov329-Pavlova_lutheri.AAC.15
MFSQSTSFEDAQILPVSIPLTFVHVRPRTAIPSFPSTWNTTYAFWSSTLFLVSSSCTAETFPLLAFGFPFAALPWNQGSPFIPHPLNPFNGWLSLDGEEYLTPPPTHLVIKLILTLKVEPPTKRLLNLRGNFLRTHGVQEQGPSLLTVKRTSTHGERTHSCALSFVDAPVVIVRHVRPPRFSWNFRLGITLPLLAQIKRSTCRLNEHNKTHRTVYKTCAAELYIES